ncbi:hypothetical protein O3M35_009348 [Rhynocoris fuscipes]|uniref:VWFA domain-containing protein n=1 Tax=Rhynocoris fuscipes TaxID=488301 RepID=A0AAW1D8J9_9HEMI
MASNKIATVVLFDVGSSVSQIYDNSEPFFKRTQWCLLRIIQRLIFSGENDEIAVVIFGSIDTDNNMDNTEEGMYSNIVEFSNLQKADWYLYERVQQLTTTNIINSNWIEGLIVSLDYLKNQCKGKRFKDKQIIMLSNFAMELSCSESKVNVIAESMNIDNIKLVTIGIDLEDQEIISKEPGSIGILMNLLDKVENGVSLSFIEAEEDIIYFKKKGKMGRFTKVNLTIGSKIDIPIRWVRKPSKKLNDLVKVESTTSMDIDESETDVRFIMENQKVTKFGNTEVIIDYADIEAMKRQTGPASCILLGCVKSYRIRREMFIGSDIYLVVAEKSSRAQAMYSAFIDALIANDKYALVRRVTVNNGKIKVGVLIPVSHQTENGISKELYFLQLPFAEYQMCVPEVKMPEPNDEEILETFDNLIDTMMISDKPKDVPMKDPWFQYRCHILQLYQTGMLKSDDEDPPVPDFIQKLVDPYPELLENALPIIQKLEKLLPIHIDEKYLDPEESITIKDSLIEANTSNNTKEKTDWTTADTEEWPDEVKEEFKDKSLSDDITLPTISLNKDVLAKNKYNTNYVSDRLWKDHGNKEEISADVQQMIDERQDTQQYDTEEMLQRLKKKF